MVGGEVRRAKSRSPPCILLDAWRVAALLLVLKRPREVQQGVLRFDQKTEYDHQRYIEKNYWLWSEFKKRANELLELGRTYYSARDILASIRWDHRDCRAGKGGGEFKVNNNISSFLARKLMDEDSRFKGFFQTRRAPKLKAVA